MALNLADNGQDVERAFCLYGLGLTVLLYGIGFILFSVLLAFSAWSCAAGTGPLWQGPNLGRTGGSVPAVPIQDTSSQQYGF